jgi:glycosyltransferase involved in cell wall biosynthesis
MTELIRRLDRERFVVHVACFRRTGEWLPRVEGSVASITEFPLNGFARAGTLQQLMSFGKWCRQQRIRVIQTCDFYSNVFGLPGALLGGVDIRIGSRRELNPDKSPAQIRLQRLAYRAATRIVANSPAAAAMLASEGVAQRKVSVIANGLEGTAYVGSRRTGPIRRVITIANLRPEKSHETLIAAAPLLQRTHPDLRYLIVGDGSRRAELEALARVKGVDGLFEFLGHREDVPQLLADADAFVLPSRSEAFPNCLLEAMAAGLPVVASAVGGILDLVEPGRTGILVPPSDAQALAAALRTLTADPAQARAMGAAARCEVLARYSFDRMVRAFEDLYETELQARHLVPAQAARAGV